MNIMNMKKKKEGDLSDNEKDAKMSAVQAMRDMAAQMMGDKLGSLKKVTVASNDKTGLAEGLDKAKELLNKHDDSEDESHEDPKEEDSETPEMEKMEDDGEHDEDHNEHDDEHEPMSEDEINTKLEELMALKKKIESRKA